MKIVFKLLILIVLLPSLLAAFAQNPNVIKLRNKTYYGTIEDIKFTTVQHSPSTRWDAIPPETIPLEKNSVDYYDPLDYSPFVQSETFAAQLNLIDSYYWLKSKLKPQKSRGYVY